MDFNRKEGKKFNKNLLRSFRQRKGEKLRNPFKLEFFQKLTNWQFPVTKSSQIIDFHFRFMHNQEHFWGRNQFWTLKWCLRVVNTARKCQCVQQYSRDKTFEHSCRENCITRFRRENSKNKIQSFKSCMEFSHAKSIDEHRVNGKLLPQNVWLPKNFNICREQEIMTFLISSFFCNWNLLRSSADSFLCSKLFFSTIFFFFL